MSVVTKNLRFVQYATMQNLGVVLAQNVFSKLDRKVHENVVLVFWKT